MSKSGVTEDDAGTSLFTTELTTDDGADPSKNDWSIREGFSAQTSRQILEATTAEHYNTAMVAKKSRQWDEAILNFTKCVNLRPREASYYSYRGEVYVELCDFQSAILNYKRACILDPNNASFVSRLAFLHLFHGQTLFDQNMYAEALEAFSRAAELQPDKAHYQNRSLACLAALHRHSECLALVNQRLNTEAGNADLLVLRARLNNMFRNYTLCFYDLKDALEADPEHQEALTMQQSLAELAKDCNNKAVDLGLGRRTAEALHKISLAIDMDPTVAEYHVKRGAFQRRLGNYNAAVDDYLLALDKTNHDENSPVYKEAHRQLLLAFNDFGVECFKKGFYDEAIVLFNKAILSETTERGLYVNRGDCFYKKKSFTFALADFMQAYEMDNTDKSVAVRISLVHHQFGQRDYAIKSYETAENHFTEAISFNPTVSYFWIARARCAYMMSNYTPARHNIVTALLICPEQEALLSLISRLFPGKGIHEVASSKLAVKASRELQALVDLRFPRISHPDEKLSGEGSASRGEPSTLMSSAATTRRSVLARSKRHSKGRKSTYSTKSLTAEKSADHEALWEVVLEKRVLEREINKLLDSSRNLKKNTLPLLPMKPPLPYIIKGECVGREQNVQHFTETGSIVDCNQGWQKFASEIK